MGGAPGPVASYQERSAAGSRSASRQSASTRRKSGFLDRLVGPHRRRGGAQQKPQVPPFDRQVLELQHGRGRELRVQIVLVETDRRERDARLHATLQLEQLDLQIHGGREVRLFLFQSSELGDLTRFGSGGRENLRIGHRKILS